MKTTLYNIGRKRRYRPTLGDVFVMQADPVGYLVCRVIRILGEQHPIARGCLMVYVYHPLSACLPTLEQAVSIINMRNLAMPPFFTYPSIITSGCGLLVGNIPLHAHDILSKHCFESLLRPGTFVNEDLETVSYSEPCGQECLNPKISVEYLFQEHLIDKPRTYRIE